jgi:hypothetical protein
VYLKLDVPKRKSRKPVPTGEDTSDWPANWIKGPLTQFTETRLDGRRRRIQHIWDFSNMDVDAVVLGVVPSKRGGSEDLWRLTPTGQKTISKAITELEARMQQEDQGLRDAAREAAAAAARAAEGRRAVRERLQGIEGLGGGR